MRKNFVKKYRTRIGETLRELRLAREYTQQDLADLMDVNRATISKIESGTFALTIDYLAKFAWYLKFDIELVPKVSAKKQAVKPDEYSEKNKKALQSLVTFKSAVKKNLEDDDEDDNYDPNAGLVFK